MEENTSERRILNSIKLLTAGLFSRFKRWKENKKELSNIYLITKKEIAKIKIIHFKIKIKTLGLKIKTKATSLILKAVTIYNKLCRTQSEKL